MKTMNVGLIGFGTIGSGVVKALRSKRSALREKSGIDIRIARVCDKDLKTKRQVKVDKNLLTGSIGKVLYDPKIDIVIELIGGIRPAKDIVLEALRQGKHVVTANKALLSEAGSEIFSLANKLGLCVGFEASVGGGIPIIRSLKEGFVANRMDLIYGIINGTSNFILSSMTEGGHGFKEALAIAQANGYAERDPRLDISGMDSAHKLAILTALGFGLFVKPGDIYTEGIEDIEAGDIQYAKELGYEVKLLAIAKRAQDMLELRVHPTLIPKSRLLANVGGVYNAIFVKGDLIGENLFYGQGAGAKATSSAVVSDIISIAKEAASGAKVEQCAPFVKDVNGAKVMGDVKTRYYIRFSAIDKPGVLAKISGILGKHRISIASVSQKARKTAKIVPIVMMTHEALERDMAKALKEIDGLSMIKKRSVRIRVED
ncbi:MAG: homoserine dehydrogenase [Candidatus Omnitrophica bacterium]|nr:homoserine dehydrogenase [Candidatus Omnitrophota bacterium]